MNPNSETRPAPRVLDPHAPPLGGAVVYWGHAAAEAAIEARRFCWTFPDAFGKLPREGDRGPLTPAT